MRGVPAATCIKSAIVVLASSDAADAARAQCVKQWLERALVVVMSGGWAVRVAERAAVSESAGSAILVSLLRVLLVVGCQLGVLPGLCLCCTGSTNTSRSLDFTHGGGG